MRLLLGGLVHHLEGMTDCIQVQEFQVVQGIVLPTILMEVTADKVGKMDKARVNEGRRGITKDDRLEFRDRIEGGKLDEVGNKLEPTERDREVNCLSHTSIQSEMNTNNNKLSVSGLIFWSEKDFGFVLFAI